jgi:hypothetical protein
MMVSPGCSRPKNTAWLACEPELGCTLAKSAPNSCFSAVDGQLLDHVDVLAAAVVALAGVALGVLVGQLRALRGHHGRARCSSRGDQLDVLFLAAVLGLDGGPDLGVDVGDGGLVERSNMAVLFRGEGPSRAGAAHAVEGCPGERLTGRAGGRPARASRWSSTSGACPGAAPIASRAAVQCSAAQGSARAMPGVQRSSGLLRPGRSRRGVRRLGAVGAPASDAAPDGRRRRRRDWAP